MALADELRPFTCPLVIGSPLLPGTTLGPKVTVTSEMPWPLLSANLLPSRRSKATGPRMSCTWPLRITMAQVCEQLAQVKDHWKAQQAEVTRVITEDLAEEGKAWLQTLHWLHEDMAGPVSRAHDQVYGGTFARGTREFAIACGQCGTEDMVSCSSWNVRKEKPVGGHTSAKHAAGIPSGALSSDQVYRAGDLLGSEEGSQAGCATRTRRKVICLSGAAPHIRKPISVRSIAGSKSTPRSQQVLPLVR
jgi:hypothetical protein